MSKEIDAKWGFETNLADTCCLNNISPDICKEIENDVEFYLKEEKKKCYEEIIHISEEMVKEERKVLLEKIEEKIKIHKEIIATHSSLPIDWHEGNIKGLEDIKEIIKII